MNATEPPTWQRVLARYIFEQRNKVAAVYAVGSMEFDGAMDGLRILECHLFRPLEDITYTLARRLKAGAGMILEGERWCFGEVRRHKYATRQVFSGAEIVMAACGGQQVCDRARARCAELVENIRKQEKIRN